MLTTDLALRVDPAYEAISRRFLENPDQFADAFARAWFKLTHRDMGPRARYLGPEVPAEVLIWQDPIPALDHALVDAQDVAALKSKVLASGLTVSELVSTAWASASTFRGSDKRGGANGARIRLAPQKDWAVNQPQQLARVLETLEGIRAAFNAAPGRRQEGVAGRPDRAGRQCRGRAGRQATPATTSRVPFTPGAWTPRRSRPTCNPSSRSSRSPTVSATTRKTRYSVPAEALLVDRAQLLTLTAPEMTVLVGGLRVLGANTGQAQDGVLHQRPGQPEQRLLRQPARHGHGSGTPPRAMRDRFEGRDRKTGEQKWTATRVDLVFGSNAQLRAIAEVYAAPTPAGSSSRTSSPPGPR